MDNSKKFAVMLNKAISQEPNGFGNFDRTKNVQDQLQEMLGDFTQVQAMLNDLDDWHRAYDAHLMEIKSMEQLWLAFIMSEKFNKVWSGESWISKQ